jgi:ketosteroid isomerase-like protein
MSGSSRTPSTEAEVWQVVEAFNRAFAANDSERYFSFIANDVTVLTPSNPYRVEGIADDREEFEWGLRMGMAKIGYFQELHPLVRIFGDVAVVTYFSRSSYGEAGNIAYLKETDVLVRHAQEWKIIHIHVSSTT